uniref:ATP-dependent helicase Rep n=1 Tax=Diporeia sp. associated circular virus TaxID=1299317 RepID=M1T024_9VIRU|nr:replication-associated protein [Diporeia sp. associated circular virus]
MAHITRMVIVINNPVPDDYDRMKIICGISRYAVAANEVGECGTPHIQAYVALLKDKKQRQAGWKKMLPRANLKFAKGTERENALYVKKGEQTKAEFAAFKDAGPNYGKNLDLIFEHGTMDHKGLDGTLFNCATAIAEGTVTVDEIAKEYPETFVRFHRGMRELEAIGDRKKFRNWRTTAEWVHGFTGVGKSYVWESAYDPEKMFVMKAEDKGWSDGYTGQPIVIIDELRKGQISYAMLLKMIGSGPYWLSNRGRAPTPFLAKHIYITSCYHPRDLYNDLDGDDSIDQLLDRLGGNITHMMGKSKRAVQENIFLRDIIKDALCEEASCSQETGGPQNYGLPKEFNFG